MPAETSQTLDRGLRVLELLAEAPGGLSINELAAAVGVNRTVVYRLVATLEQHNLARRDSSGRVQGGIGALLLARGVQPMLRDLAGPTLRTLAEAVGATAHLTVAEGGEGLAIAVVEPSWTDAQNLVDKGIPSVVFGAGELGTAHSDHEWVRLGDLQAVANTIATLVDEWVDRPLHPDPDAPA